MRFYRALETGQRKPTTKAQQHFVDVTLGHAPAETIHEKAYVKHMRLRTARREATRTETIHNPEDGPTADWFSREDWYRLSPVSIEPWQPRCPCIPQPFWSAVPFSRSPTAAPLPGHWQSSST
jgi:hypothetical protein